MSAPVRPQDVSRYLGRRLRAEREIRRLSLADVEARSGGRIKAVVVGSHERGGRSVSLKYLAEYAQFYEMRMADLLPPEGPSLAAASFTAITAAKDAEIERLTAEYERQLNEMRERLADCRCDHRRAS